ncbi:MAG: DNA repair protein RadC [Ottowia sp.]|nr:DNA repair protein RadC [Ottowia sp.]
MNIDHNALAAKTETRAQYAAQREINATVANEDAIIAQALEILARRMRTSGVMMDSPQVVRDWLRLRVGGKPHEEFGCIWLNAQHNLIEAGEMFRGTLTQTSVYPREVVKEALHHNAAAVIFYHNHPSGAAEPSLADEMLTRQLKDALNLVDVRVLDHFVVTAEKTTSFAEKGLL